MVHAAWKRGLKSLVGIRAIKALSNFYDRSVGLKQLEKGRVRLRRRIKYGGSEMSRVSEHAIKKTKCSLLFIFINKVQLFSGDFDENSQFTFMFISQIHSYA